MDRNTEKEIDEINIRLWKNMGNNLDNELSEAFSLLKIAENNKYKKGKAYAHLNIGWRLFFKAEKTGIINHFKEAIQLFQETEDIQGLLKAMNGQAVTYHYSGLFGEALEIYQEIIKISNDENISERQIAAFSNMGRALIDMGKPDKAIAPLEQALGRALDTKTFQHVIPTYINLGEAYNQTGESEKGNIAFQNALNFEYEDKKPIEEVYCLNGIGKSFMKSGEYRLAEKQFQKCLSLIEKTGIHQYLGEIWLNTGQLSIFRKKYKEAESALLKARNYAEKSGNEIIRRNIINNLIDLKKIQNKYKEALELSEQIRIEEKKYHDKITSDQISLLTSEFKSQVYIKEKEILKVKASQLEKEIDEIKIINQIGQKLTASLNQQHIYNQFLEYVESEFNFDRFFLGLYEPDEEKIQIIGMRENDNDSSDFSIKIAENKTPESLCIKQNRSIVSSKYPENFDIDGLEDGLLSEMESRLYLIIEENNQIIGLVGLGCRNPDCYSRLQLEQLKTVGLYLGLALNNAAIHERVNKLNNILSEEKKAFKRSQEMLTNTINHDILTDLANRSLLEKLLQHELHQCQRYNKSLAVMYIDIDAFKEINIELGEKSGDLILINLASRLKQSLRRSDIIARLDSDEFLIVLTEIKLADVPQVARKILNEVTRPIICEGKEAILSASIGISGFPYNGENTEKLISQANMARYESKQSGKNRITLASTPDISV